MLLAVMQVLPPFGGGFDKAFALRNCLIEGWHKMPPFGCFDKTFALRNCLIKRWHKLPPVYIIAIIVFSVCVYAPLQRNTIEYHSMNIVRFLS